MLGRLCRPTLLRKAAQSVTFQHVTPQLGVRSVSTTLLPEDIELLRQTCWDFAENELKPVAGDVDKHSYYPEEQVSEWIAHDNITV